MSIRARWAIPLAAIAVAVAGCTPSDNSTYVEPIADKALDQVQEAIKSAYPSANFSSTTPAQTIGADGVCAYRSADRHIDLALGSSDLGGKEVLSTALTSGLEGTGFSITEKLTAAPDGWLVLTAVDTSGVTFIFRAKDYAEFFVTSEVDISSCASPS